MRQDWIAALLLQGYGLYVAQGWLPAAQHLSWYLERPDLAVALEGADTRFRRLLCWFFRHPQFVVLHHCGMTSYKVKCIRYQWYFGINFDVWVLLPWTPDLAFCGKHD